MTTVQNPDQRAHLIGIGKVLAGLRYPAQRWELIAQAHHYGASSGYITELASLPEASFDSLDEIAGELRRNRRELTPRGRKAVLGG